MAQLAPSAMQQFLRVQQIPKGDDENPTFSNGPVLSVIQEIEEANDEFLLPSSDFLPSQFWFAENGRRRLPSSSLSPHIQRILHLSKL